MSDELLRLAGVVATVARRLVGGRDFTTGFPIRSASVYELADAADALREALDAYDAAVVAEARIREEGR